MEGEKIFKQKEEEKRLLAKIQNGTSSITELDKALEDGEQISEKQHHTLLRAYIKKNNVQ